MTVRTTLLALLALTAATTGCRADVPQAVWQEKCAQCHGDMARFAEKSLCLADAMPALREGGEKLEAFLAHHGRLTSGEVEAVCKGMTDLLSTPPKN